MLEQFLKSVIVYFQQIEPMNGYIQRIPVDVEYPCYLINKCNIETTAINSYYFLNTVTPYIRIFSKNEVDLKNKVFKIVNKIFEDGRKIPILNEDGTKSNRFVRVEDVETIDIPTEQNEIYCVEINFNFDTTYNVTQQEFDLLKNFYYRVVILKGEDE